MANQCARLFEQSKEPSECSAGGRRVWTQSTWCETENVSYSSRRQVIEGACPLEAFAVLEASLLNYGSRDTFRKAGRGSKVDLTFVSGVLAPKSKWPLDEEYINTDDEGIFHNARGIKRPKSTGPKWRNAFFDEYVFYITLDSRESGGPQLANSCITWQSCLQKHAPWLCLDEAQVSFKVNCFNVM